MSLINTLEKVRINHSVTLITWGSKKINSHVNRGSGMRLNKTDAIQGRTDQLGVITSSIFKACIVEI